MMQIRVKDLVMAIEQRQSILNRPALTQAVTDMTVTAIASLPSATKTQVSFLSNPRYHSLLASTKAGIVLVNPEHEQDVPKGSQALVVSSPYLAYACVSQLFAPTICSSKPSIHPTAIIAPTVDIADNVSIGAYCVIGERVKIGSGCQLATHVTLGDDVTLGNDCVLMPHVSIAHNCQVGHSVRIHAHASIGSEGFGFAPSDRLAEGWERIAQLGRVVIGNDVRIGSHTCIDRGAIDDTVIANDVIIDNLVQIAHNVQIGESTAIAANTGIAGSTKIGKRCIIGGAVGIIGHLDIVDDVTITAMTLVTKSIKKSGSYSSGAPMMPSAKWRRAAVRFRQID